MIQMRFINETGLRKKKVLFGFKITIANFYFLNYQNQLEQYLF